MKYTLILLTFLTTLLPLKNTNAQQLIFNEVMHSNVNGVMDELNEFPDSWVEIYNTSEEFIKTEGLYIGVSEDITKAYKICDTTQIPPYGFYTIYCDEEEIGKHTHFRIDSEEETSLYLFNKDSSLIEKIQIPAMLAPDISYGREWHKVSIDNDSVLTIPSETWGYLRTSSINAPNDSVSSQLLLGNAKFSQKGGLFKAPFFLSIKASKDAPDNTIIRYTTNGSEPNETSPIFQDSILIDHTTIIRAKQFAEGWHSPLSKTHSYIFHGRDVTLPVISITTDSANLYDDEKGIYVDGIFGTNHPEIVSEHPSFGTQNYLYNWNRPCNIEYFDIYSEKEGSNVNQNCEFRVGGNSSRLHPLKSIVVSANKRFGKKHFEYPFWDEKSEIDKTKKIYLRNAGGDFIYMPYLRDYFAQMTMGQHVDLDWCASQPSILLFNGEYKGVINLREHPKKNFFWSNYDKLENIDLIQSFFSVEAGDLTDWNQFLYLMMDTTKIFSIEDMDKLIDINECINYYILNVYFANTDWPANNYMVWKEKAPNKKWRWLAKDMDCIAGRDYVNVYNHKSLNYNLLKEPYEQHPMNQKYACSILQQLLNIPEIESEFIDKTTVYMGTFMSAKENVKRLDSITNQIRFEMEFFCQLYKIQFSNWEKSVNDLREWNEKRTDFMYHHLQDFFDLGDTTSLTINCLSPKQIYFNNIKVENNLFEGKYFQERKFYISRDSADFVYKGDTFQITKKDSLSTNSYWIVKYTLNDSTIREVHRGNSLLFQIPHHAKNVYITDTIISTPLFEELPPLTYSISDTSCFFDVKDRLDSFPHITNNLGDTIKGALVQHEIPIGKGKLQWIFTDLLGDTLSFFQPIEIIDAYTPSPTNCNNMDTLWFDITHQACLVYPNELDIPIPTATDNCDITIEGALITEEHFSFGQNHATWRFTDAAGNEQLCPQTIILKDKCAPSFEKCYNMDTISYEILTPDCEVALSEISIPTPLAYDNCDLIISGQMSVYNDYINIGNDSIVWVFSDSAGNTTTCKQTIVVYDRYAPAYDKCNNMDTVKYEILSLDCAAKITDIPISTPLAYDNCDKVIPGKIVANEKIKIGSDSIFWIFSDPYGNSTTCKQTIIVLDKSAPFMEECDKLPTIHYELTEDLCNVPNEKVSIPTLKAIDNCETTIYGSIEYLPSEFNIGSTFIQWIFKDSSNNSTTCMQEIFVEDKFAPIVNCDHVVDLSYLLPVNANEITSTEIAIPTPFATDNCGVIVLGETTLPEYFPIGTSSIVWTFTDDNNNISYCEQKITTFKQFELRIHPNPTNDVLTIAGLEPEESITLYNTIGNIVLETNSTGNPTLIDLSRFSNGLYIVKVRGEFFKILLNKK